MAADALFRVFTACPSDPRSLILVRRCGGWPLPCPECGAPAVFFCQFRSVPWLPPPAQDVRDKKHFQRAPGHVAGAYCIRLSANGSVLLGAPRGCGGRGCGGRSALAPGTLSHLAACLGAATCDA